MLSESRPYLVVAVRTVYGVVHNPAASSVIGLSAANTAQLWYRIPLSADVKPCQCISQKSFYVLTAADNIADSFLRYTSVFK